jgi:putative ABC transport system substrate-binding protein
MKQRIAIATALALAFLTALPVAEAQQTNPARIGTLFGGSPTTHGRYVNWLRQDLQDLGYVEGQNYVFVSRWAMGKYKRLPKLAMELVDEKVDVIVVNGGSSVRALGKATQTIPVVVGSAGNLGTYGFVASLARPGGNVTGSTFNTSDLTTKRLGLLKEAVTGARRVAFLFYPLGRAKRELNRIEIVGESLRLKIQPLQVRTLGEIEGAFVSMVNKGADALMINLSAVTIFHRKRIAALAIKKKIPTMCEQASFAHAGCLMSYAADRRHMMRRAAAFVVKILRGAKPADLPVELASRFKLVVNLKTAKAIGITLPASIFLQATDVIE